MASVTPTPRTGRPRSWSRARIGEELLSYVGDGRGMPTQLELRARGRADLASALTRHGGAAYWARRLGLAMSERQVRHRVSEEQLVAEARAVIAAIGYLPGENKLRQLDRAALAVAVKRAGGSRCFCARHRLPWADGRTSVIRRGRVTTG